MRAGRKPKPTALKVITGNPGKRRLPKNEPKPDTSVLPPCPPELRGEDGEPSLAETKWYALSRELHRLGLLSTIDVDQLANYCEAYARKVQAQQTMKRLALHDPVTHGQMIQTRDGRHKVNPLLGVIRDATTQMLKIAVEFGMTPSSRVRVAGGQGTGPTAGLTDEDAEAETFFGD